MKDIATTFNDYCVSAASQLRNACNFTGDYASFLLNKVKSKFTFKEVTN